METSIAPRPDEPGSHADSPSGRALTWRTELQRWLATLNPGRTPREYEKAVRYFFETPGVPDELETLTFDLLLAYRGALALRATPHHQRPPRTKHVPVARVLLGSSERTALTGETPDETRSDGAERGGEERRNDSGPLAPATVNIRLTALRQFLCHCALNGSLPQLSPDRIRGALRRLSIERRRPYQVLAEAEWVHFLEAARAPAAAGAHMTQSPDMVLSESGEHGAPRTGPWGRTRAERAAMEPAKTHDTAPDEHAQPVAGPPVRPRARLTGKRTGQRDHALIALALATGLRAIELVSLDVGDLHRERQGSQDEWWLVLPDEKTKGQHGGRTLPLAPTLMESLLAYIRSTGRRWEDARDRTTPLFLSTHGVGRQRDPEVGGHRSQEESGRRLSPSQVRLIVDRVENQWRTALDGGSGDERSPGEARAISPHALRHSTAVALLEGNEAQGRPPASVEHVRGWLGHFDIRTTQGYLAHLDARRHRRPFTLAPPVGQQEPVENDVTHTAEPGD